ncbi:virion structural protein [Bacillus phage vB_BcoS-136]|uniref:Tail tube protein n=1 Tax=Bacillus phage vB_BcoS-136 TaxID=2419619 RepID=A0A3G3BVH2_9CAUD|nr:virion structural protein [Bacillus phage vB_BcoS-136]AYP68255.1 hypothetical protein vBBcoS136_00140 [Bacillus phage vB_BcoS-136]
MSVRYGLKEVANVIFFDIATNKPAILFDTLKVSTIENESESAEARGGQGNGRLLSWDYGRTATLNMQDALLSDSSLAMLSGNAVKKNDVRVVGRETLTVIAGGVELKETPITGTVTIFKSQNGIMTEEIADITVEGKTITITGASEGDQVLAFYEYTVESGASQITFSANAFPATYRVVGDTIVRGEDGLDRKMQFVIPRAKLQSAFSLTMDVENVSTFDFNLDVMVESGTGRLYDIIRLGN